MSSSQLTNHLKAPTLPAPCLFQLNAVCCDFCFSTVVKSLSHFLQSFCACRYICLQMFSS